MEGRGASFRREGKISRFYKIGSLVYMVNLLRQSEQYGVLN